MTILSKIVPDSRIHTLRVYLPVALTSMVRIALVPCAVGGTPIRRWCRGGDLYKKMLARAKIAAEAGVLKGILWHQGEGDSHTDPGCETGQSGRSVSPFGCDDECDACQNDEASDGLGQGRAFRLPDGCDDPREHRCQRL